MPFLLGYEWKSFVFKSAILNEHLGSKWKNFHFTTFSNYQLSFCLISFLNIYYKLYENNLLTTLILSVCFRKR